MKFWWNGEKILEIKLYIDKFKIKVIEKLEDEDYLVDITNYSDFSIKHGVLSPFID